MKPKNYFIKSEISQKNLKQVNKHSQNEKKNTLKKAKVPESSSDSDEVKDTCE